MDDARVGRVFAALSDPHRRAIVERLAREPEVTLGELSRGLPVTRQAVAKHLAALGQAGIVTGERSGREVRYRLTPAPMGEAITWMAAAGAEWDDRLARLRGYVS